jgi:tRNA pseudouridine38-40 synthase|tara:strand:- start:1460 stop:2206 length:747 start_codon:yes stop_codon:yes gene_type:complete
MFRYKAIIEYEGSLFAGWQKQNSSPTIQSCLEDAIKKYCLYEVNIEGAGRTDSGVHAFGQVIHFDLKEKRDLAETQNAINFHLRPNPISVLDIIHVKQDFHARFEAIQRQYLYRIIIRSAPPALERGRVWWVSKELSLEKMQMAGNFLIGKHDFSTFRSSQCQANSPIRTIDSFEVSSNNGEINFFIKAKSFLHKQVRSMIGSVKFVGEGKWTTDQFLSAFKSCDRNQCAKLAPPDGLYLYKVVYPER